MNNNRIVILLGAGATVPWGGKTSDDLSKIVLDPEGKGNIIVSETNKIPLGKYLQQILEEYYQNESDVTQETVNFEQVLEIIEILFSYYRNKKFTNHIWARPSFPSVFNIENDIDKEIPEEEVEIYGIENDRLQKKSVTLYKLYLEVLSRLCEHVNDYSQSIGKDAFKEKDHEFCGFINSLSGNNILRIYSLNYDNLIQQQSGLDKKFYNGFDLKDSEYRSNYTQIVQNTDKNCFFNLHGSFYFQDKPVDDFTRNELVYNPEGPVVKRPEHRNEFLGMPLISSQIITGNQKLFKTLIEPLSAFTYAFRYDCLDAIEIIVIGYSFGDSHINSVIASALDSNDKNRLKIITMIDNPNSFWNFQNQMIRAFKNQKKEIQTIVYADEHDWLYSENKTFSIYTKGFLS